MTVVVYGKPDCPLCDKALTIVARLKHEFGYQIAHTDITGDPALFTRYRDEIPVIVLDGREIAPGRVTLSTVRASLAQAVRR